VTNGQKGVLGSIICVFFTGSRSNINSGLADLKVVLCKRTSIKPHKEIQQNGLNERKAMLFKTDIIWKIKQKLSQDSKIKTTSNTSNESDQVIPKNKLKEETPGDLIWK
jgi:hypothetical protein